MKGVEMRRQSHYDPSGTLSINLYVEEHLVGDDRSFLVLIHALRSHSLLFSRTFNNYDQRDEHKKSGKYPSHDEN